MWDHRSQLDSGKVQEKRLKSRMRPFPEGAGPVEVLQKLGGRDFYSDKTAQALDGINGIPLAASNKRRTIQASFFFRAPNSICQTKS